jgi:hypothetical protein
MEVGKWQPEEAQLITRSLSRSPGLRLSLSVFRTHKLTHRASSRLCACPPVPVCCCLRAAAL